MAQRNYPEINIWYGDHQRFGFNGHPQRWVNILGDIGRPDLLENLTARVNGGAEIPLSVGPDGHRLAAAGDFNLEIDFADLGVGENRVEILVRLRDGATVSRSVVVEVAPSRPCPLPFHIDWRRIRNIQDVAMITDGRWELTPAGVRVVAPYYDRVLALGDLSWTDYEVRTTVTFHALRAPNPKAGDAGANVIHAALAVRWPGHDTGGFQPRRKWYPLGATAEFQVNPQWQGCSWRFLDGTKRVLADGNMAIRRHIPYGMVHRVTTLADRSSRYQVRLWPGSTSEPEGWDLEMIRPPGTPAAGGALLIAHYSVVTFGNVSVLPM